MKKYYEKGKINKIWIDDYCKGSWLNCIRYKMEEKSKYHPDWMMPDGSINKELM